jgi:anthranilate/para-aminobenzoate synthase component II
LGGTIGRAKHPFHGSAQSLQIAAHAQFVRDLPPAAKVARYNSLVVQNLPRELATAWNDAQEIEALEIYSMPQPAVGVQFHPESFLSDGMDSLREKWIRLVNAYYAHQSK